ncbi:MAG: ABC transporter ATP-binding protein, partial [Actinomycetota bacterium]
MNPLIEVSGLRVTFEGGVAAVRNVSFSVGKGDSLAIVGESGSGKSTLAMCLAGLIQPPEASGSVKVSGSDLLGASPQVLREVRWAQVAIGLQGAPFNPVVSVGAQIAEPLLDRLGMAGKAAERRAAELAQEALLDASLLEAFPHQLSGGERRRALLAMVLALDPDFVVLDEPTAGLDQATKGSLIERINSLRAQHGFGLVVISHDLPDAAQLAAESMVMYAGEAMEQGATPAVLGDPAHPYTWALVNAYPVMSTTKDIRPIRGLPPDPRAVSPGCPFNPRCTQAEQQCIDEHADLRQSRGRMVACHFGGLKTLLAAEAVSKTFRENRRETFAVRGVSIELREGESVGVVGPSGSGKTTLARILTGHIVPDSGRVMLEDEPLESSWRRGERHKRRRIQLVMQDPWDALSPRMTVEQLVAEPLELNGTAAAERREKVADCLRGVGLPVSAGFLGAFTHQLSGGQLQRIALARALVAGPKLLVADEPTAMLDSSEQARLLQVLKERQVEMGLGLILISHDIAVVRKVCDRIVVLD